MMRLVVRCIASILILTSVGVAQISFDFTGSGARANAMGGAYLGVADGASAVGWNPAGLWSLESPIVGFSYGWYVPKGELVSNNLTTDISATYQAVRELSFSAPVRIRGQQFVFSASYHRLFEDYTYSQTLDSAVVLFNGEQIELEQQVRHEAHHAPNALDVGFGTRISSTIGIGAALNIFLGKGVTDIFISSGADSVNYRSDGQYAPTVQTLRLLDTTAYSGVGITLGLKYSGEKLSAGLVGRIPFTFKTTTDRKFFRVVNFAGFPDPDASDTTYFDDILLKYSIPAMVGAGVSYLATEKLLLSADVEYRPFSSGSAELRISRTIRSGQDDIEVFRDVDVDWEDAFIFRAGGEYTWETGKSAFPIVPLRAGFGFQPIPTPDRDLDDNTSAASGMRFTGGFGVRWSLIHLDFSYSYATLDRSVVSTAYGLQEILPYLTVGQEEEAGLMFRLPAKMVDHNSRVHDFRISFTGYF